MLFTRFDLDGVQTHAPLDVVSTDGGSSSKTVCSHGTRPAPSTPGVYRQTHAPLDVVSTDGGSASETVCSHGTRPAPSTPGVYRQSHAPLGVVSTDGGSASETVCRLTLLGQDAVEHSRYVYVHYTHSQNKHVDIKQVANSHIRVIVKRC